MAMSAEYLKISSPSTVMATFPIEWKILQWDDKPKQSKHYWTGTHLNTM